MSQFAKPPQPNPIQPPRVEVEHKAGDQLRRHKDDIFFAAIETTRMPMIVTDPRQPDNPIVFANRAFLSMTGYTEADIVGRNCRLLQGPATDRETIRSIREAVADRRELNTEVLNYRKDGSSFWNALFISPVFDADRTLVYFFASQLDVSRRRDAEESLAQAQKMEALGQLTGGISHDFNNLLQVMRGHMDITRMRLQKIGTPELEPTLKSIESVQQAIGKAATLTQHLLAFSRKQRLQGRVINLNITAGAVKELVQQTLGNGIEVSARLAPELANCQVDPTQLEVALLNVLINARDAMPDGGQITVKTSNVLVEVQDSAAFHGLAPGAYVSLSVSDSGNGIPAAMIGRVMEPFFTTKDEGKGTGLGLSMVYGFVKQSGGTVQIYSEEGVGTTVRMYFPAAFSPLAEKSSQPLHGLEIRGGSEKILVVDDRVEVAQLAHDALQNLGYDVQMAHHGREALDLVAALPSEDRPHMLFSDIVMPGGMNGYALAREIRRLIPDVRILLTTGYEGEENFADANGSAEFDVLRKPYLVADLARKVRTVLDGATGANLHSNRR
ncbi:histidine kinase famiy protein [Xylophilus sp. GOD-11R]|uniref:histidine kinase famiy protein n=1 Tax=Xylophilus sp. GOD-11R TaxID=3089814 RepID=UPI00298CD9BF|nr:histidine kinase famiy protein [Xylophilus sp. GOD-11R]WPB55837.1 histidine kinase famiy protein [Xylophilus sp. GOD-11R]